MTLQAPEVNELKMESVLKLALYGEVSYDGGPDWPRAVMRHSSEIMSDYDC